MDYDSGPGAVFLAVPGSSPISRNAHAERSPMTSGHHAFSISASSAANK